MNDILTEESQQVIMRPTYTGMPTPSITWLRNGQLLSSGNDQDINLDGSLCLPCVRKEHAGRFVTVGNNLININ